MIVTDKFVFIHMHKTGGQSLNRIIGQCIPRQEHIGYHFPRAALPEIHEHLPVVGIVRNPWDWYVSWYSFNRRKGIRNPLFTVLSADGANDFETTIANLVNLGSDTEESRLHRALLAEILPQTLDGNRGVGLTTADLDDLAGCATGYLSWLFTRMTGDDIALVGRFENLQESFLQIMRDIGVDEIDAIEDAFANEERKNVSSHSHYSHYYSDKLRDLIAEREQPLINRFKYVFENVPGFSPPDANEAESGFRKLLGRADNYLQLHDGMDVSALAAKLSTATPEEWAASGRERRFDVHKDTQALMLIHFEDHSYTEPEYRELYTEYEAELEPIIEHIRNFYDDNGFVIRLIFAKLAAGGQIPEHTDTGYSLLNCHRVHIPIISNDDAIFFVGGEEKVMRPGEFWEINNGGRHAVHNRGSEDRVHLIVDWMPNTAGLPHKVAVESPDGTAVASDSDSLNLMVAEAFQLQRAGDFLKARSMYKQVLDIDPGHVEANNLLGLMALQSKDPEDAIRYIETALKRKTDDAQAYANLGLALKDVGRFADAAASIQRSIELNPNNPRTHNNLGNLQRQLGDPEAAITSYQKALQLQAGYAEAHRNLGSIMMQLERYPQAVHSLRQAVVLRPDFRQAKAELEKALQALSRQARG